MATIQTTRQKRGPLRTLLFHFRPKQIPAATLKFTLTWGLGGMAAVLIFNQLATGILLKFFYQPTTSGAYPSIIFFQNNWLFGQLIRNLHYWGANLLSVIMLLHMLRVVFTGAYRSPRRGTWLIGLGLMGCVLTANVSGYLLPWDQLAYWATTVWVAMLDYIPFIGEHLAQTVGSGSEIGQASLHLFYTVHTAIVPLFLLILLPYHFWRIRKASGLVIPRSSCQQPQPSFERVPVYPDLLIREATTALCLVAFLLLLAVFFNAPLGDPANPGLSPNPTKAPWFMAAFQEILLHIHPQAAVVVVPLLLIIGLGALPFINLPRDCAGVWFISRAGRQSAIAAGVAAMILTPVIIFGKELLYRNEWVVSLPLLVKEGLIPLAGFSLATMGIYLLVKKSSQINEAIQAVFTFLVGIWIALTIICVWFRGEQMLMAWPWN